MKRKLAGLIAALALGSLFAMACEKKETTQTTTETTTSSSAPTPVATPAMSEMTPPATTPTP
ncbi:MAG TPA: hypothetical protein VMQ61_15380 [Thermoanaerobaculia bacterium]|jgi:hypothetical protein|nr:hypothetical protein [Thermoanaerobaculia bacterium]